VLSFFAALIDARETTFWSETFVYGYFDRSCSPSGPMTWRVVNNSLVIGKYTTDPEESIVIGKHTTDPEEPDAEK
jgi:hypothetical protein